MLKVKKTVCQSVKKLKLIQILMLNFFTQLPTIFFTLSY